MARVRSSWFLMMLLAALLVLLPRLGALALTNSGSLTLVRAVLLLERDGAWEQQTSLLEQARARFEQALELNGGHTAARWGLARAILPVIGRGVGSGNEAVVAAGALRPLVIDGTRSPLLYQDALTALSRSDQHYDVIALYEANPPLARTQTVSDTVALAYLHRGEPGDLAKALTLRPGDLYTNYHLWRVARDTGDAWAASLRADALRRFPLEAVNPTDERLLDYAAEVIPALLKVGLWDRNKTLNAVSFLVWQHHGAACVEQLLERLVDRYTTEAGWTFYLAELYHRRGELDQASTTYRQTLAIDPHYAQTYLRLGLLNEYQARESANDHGLAEAAKWYEQYHGMSPDDILGLKKLTEVCTELKKAGVDDERCRQAAERLSDDTLRDPADALLEALDVRTDGRRIVATLLGIPAESVELEPNLVENGGFEEWLNGLPRGWRWSDMATGHQWNEGLFVGGNDRLNSWDGRAARVDGLWLQNRPNKEGGRSGYWHSPISLDTDELYLVTFFYRTGYLRGGRPSLWLSLQEYTLFAGDHFLPDTRGKWRRFAVLGSNVPSEISAIEPMLRSWGPGELEFDEVSVRRVMLKGSTEPPDISTQFVLR